MFALSLALSLMLMNAVDAINTFIPNRVIFTYRINLLTTDGLLLTTHERRLRTNVWKTIRMHPGADVLFYDDARCARLIRDLMGEAMETHFNAEVRGMYKGDVCRGAALWRHGGYYLDVDMEAVVDVRLYTKPSTTYLTALDVWGAGHFQSIWATVPRHPAVHGYLDRFMAHYEGHLHVDGLLGVVIARMAFDDVARATLNKVQFFVEVNRDVDRRAAYVPHQWGDGCCCNFVVLDPETATVVFYSRALGTSAKCDVRSTNVARQTKTNH